jgi:hypothetical protein
MAPSQVSKPLTKVYPVFKEGVICNTYNPNLTGQVTALQEPNRPLDMFIDYSNLPYTPLPSIPDPRKLPPSSLRSIATAFAKTNPSARFAVLRLWSSPHFYPLMLGFDKRQELAFQDSAGRAWVWKFIPKDMTYSEWSIHNQARLRVEPFKQMFGEKVIVRGDLFLVMGVDEEELIKFATGVVFAIQTRPWRLEVDLWRSFVNVDAKFVEELHDKWLD